MAEKLDIAVVGATGAVGEAVLDLLAQRRFPAATVHALGGEGVAGSRLEFRDGYLRVGAVADFDFARVQLALFCGGRELAAEHAERAAATGCVVIDSSPQFRGDDDVPLVVPEVNPAALAGYRARRIVAGPGSATVQLVAALQPLRAAAGLERVSVASYQSVSLSGKAGIDELARQTALLLNGREVKPRVYPRQIAFNCLPLADEPLANGYSREEMQLVWEARKVFAEPALAVSPTAVLVPMFHGCGQAVHLTTREPLSAVQARELLGKAPGLKVLEGTPDGGYPTPVTDAAHEDAVFVGRIREDISQPKGLNFWIVADNVRMGAALNSVRIAELLVRDHL